MLSGFFDVFCRISIAFQGFFSLVSDVMLGFPVPFRDSLFQASFWRTSGAWSTTTGTGAKRRIGLSKALRGPFHVVVGSAEGTKEL